MHPDPEMRNPAAGQDHGAISQTNFNTVDNATAEKADQPETALAAAFREAARRKVVRS
jgi:hypothetical protein